MSGARTRMASHVALALLVALSAPTLAATRTPSPPPAGATQFYAALPLPERVGLQTDLIWTGPYEGVADGEMSASAIAAVRAFQSRNGGKPTGVLNPQEQKELTAAARTARQAVGWRLLDDPATGVRLGLPTKFVTRTTQGANTSRFASVHGELQIETFRIDAPGTTLAAVFDQHRKEPSRSIESAVLRPDFFVISGEQGGVKKFSVRAAIKSGEVRGAIIRYDVSTQGMFARLVTAMASAFVAFPSEPLGGAEAQRRVEYATGIVVAGGGPPGAPPPPPPRRRSCGSLCRWAPVLAGTPAPSTGSSHVFATAARPRFTSTKSVPAPIATISTTSLLASSPATSMACTTWAARGP
jgi:peptidoglycan hydrolase-like protein with peptidoglycan-binding domain